MLTCFVDGAEHGVDLVYGVLYVSAKLATYSAWSWLGLRLLAPRAANLGRAIGYGLVRLAIGICFGILVFIFYRTDNENLFAKYLAIYIPIRFVEWGLLAIFILQTQGIRQGHWGRILAWIAGGILASFAADLLSPEGLAGHFCVGRCLC
jgi:hypothetical protein